MPRKNIDKQRIFVYFDDSGTLHKNSKDHFFVYAGYVFLSQKEKDRALAAYRAAERRLRTNFNRCAKLDELKACHLSGDQKRFLNSTLREYEALACIVDENRVYDSILSNKKSIHRYKDYCLKRVVKNKLQELIHTGRIDPRAPTELLFLIDNQSTATNGVYNLQESITEEFQNGIINFDYGAQYPPLFSGELKVHVRFCDSRQQPLVRACDLIANEHYYKYNFSPDMSTQNQHCTRLFLP